VKQHRLRVQTLVFVGFAAGLYTFLACSACFVLTSQIRGGFRRPKLLSAETVRIQPVSPQFETGRPIEASPPIVETPGNCEIHRLRMTMQPVIIAYAFMLARSDDLRAEEASFPNSDNAILGGCDYDPRVASHLADKAVCDRCNAATDGWRRSDSRK
jgi:hypothetical protein